MNKTMQEIKHVIFFILFLVHFSLYGESPYILCFDGGGSKTLLQVLDSQGHIMSLIQNGVKTDKIQSDGSNMNTLGLEGVRACLRRLLKDLKIEGENQDLATLLPRCQIVAGMAGISLPHHRQAIISLFEEWGIDRHHMTVMTDAELALQLIDGQGIILISGTGSICLGKKDDALFRVGGLGRILGDEGSGYQMGLQAFKSALAEEYGWGKSTNLTPALKNFFSVAELKVLIPQINSGEISPSTIAGIAPFIFTTAEEGDAIAKEIIQGAAYDLGHLLNQMLQISCLTDCEIHLWGGIFKSAYADAFIQKIVENIPCVQKKLKILNQSHHNAAVLFSHQFILCNKLNINQL